MNLKTALRGLAICGALALPAAAQAAGDVIRIGVLNDQSGVFADNGGLGSVAAARLAAEEFGNTILGKRIEIITADHQNKPDIASTIARKWIDQDGVDLIADGAASSAGFGILNVVNEKGKIFVVTGPGASDFTGKACSPQSFHFNYDTYALAKITGKAITEAGGKNWYFVTADYAFGHALQRDATQFIQAAGGKVIGSAAHPLNAMDFSSFLLQAQSSKADVIGLATSGKDVQTAIKQANEFGIVTSGQKLAGLLVFITDVNALGLEAAKGLQVTTSFYWDANDETRAWFKRFMKVSGGRVPPTMIHAGTYSGVRHYLAAIKAAGTDDPKIVAAKMREMPVEDMYNKKVEIRADGRVLHDMFLVQVKTPAESKYPYDYYKIVQKVPGNEAFRPLSESECSLVKK
ncbi:ABC transporter substrate-binding protein [Enterovirga rhinocerotis]|uniref:Branched-chain amino acid transport system substrate-binding protein n=1 Tax=Enterovirga rhinocerotis TaxID=1339210 RepID=A0A4R7BKD5_9HYPH|nr:ABC transporter substrate-binding protein [Enterovirga rhinocerotis]TDR85493.1 branched-chain amino acid transport system substrate-binding protein [Enterovirga rhinocerotis]